MGQSSSRYDSLRAMLKKVVMFSFVGWAALSASLGMWLELSFFLMFMLFLSMLP